MLELSGDDLPTAEKYMKPCPFCGCNVSLKRGGADGKLISINCPEESSCRGPRLYMGFLDDDIETAIKQWNARATIN